MRALRCWIVTVPWAKSMSSTVRASASETRQPRRKRSLINSLSRR